ncbi:MAG: hypothetical protein HWN66_10730 [Candidatus Helarchaeota archaeon]|nr:hypothetical protein [Candidatus Helarchaeota archaeon]
MPEESLEEKMKISKAIRENLVKADQAVKDKKYSEAANYYKSASDLSNSLGHIEIAQDYLNKVNELRKMAGEPSVLDKPVQDTLENFVKRADKAISAGNFAIAAKIYEKAAREIPQNAEKLLSEAIELRNKAKDLVVARKEIQRKTGGKQEYEATLEKIKVALENNQYQELVGLYGRAAVLAEKIGRRQEAGEYRKAAIEVKRKAIKEMRSQPKNGRIQVVQQYTQILKQIKNYLDEKMWQEAADGYLTAAKLSYELEELDRAKLYKEKAAKIQEQANILEHATRLKQKERSLLSEINTLDPDKETEHVIQNYQELATIYKELEHTEGLNQVNEGLKKIRKIKERKESLKKANIAMEQEDHSKALELFQNALRISIDLHEPVKAEGFRNIINELSGKVDKVARNRMMIEERSEILTKAKAAIKQDPPNISQAIQGYKEASRISFELGENEIAKSYLQTAKRMEEDKDLIIERENFIKDAEAAIKEKNFVLASKYYAAAAKFSDKLGDETGEKYRKKAKALQALAEEL